MPVYSKEQVEKAREIDLLTYLRNYDPFELVHLQGNVYCTRTHDSLKISNGKWMWWSRGIGGVSALDYLIKVRGHPFIEAVQMILGKEAERPPILLPEKAEMKARRLLLPERNSIDDQVISYLMGRGIDEEIIEECIKRDLIYESLPYHNCIFLGFDEEGTARYAAFRATKEARIMGEAAGSSKKYCFKIEGEGDTVHIFESAIDLLSYATLRKIRTGKWDDENLLSLAGVYQPKADIRASKVPIALRTFLESHTATGEIMLHLDNDFAGRNAGKALKLLLNENYKVQMRPPAFGKDYNDYLLHILGQEGKENRK